MLAVPRPLEVAPQSARDRALGSGRGLDRAVVERPEPGIRLGLEPRRRPSASDHMPDLVQSDEVGDLTPDRRDFDLEPPPSPANRTATRRVAGQLDAVFATEVLDVRLHELHAKPPAACTILPEHERQRSAAGGG